MMSCRSVSRQLLILVALLAVLGCARVDEPEQPEPSVGLLSPEVEGDERQPATYYGRTLAIIIGIDAYSEEEWRQLERATHDARSVYQILRQEFGYVEGDIKLLLNSQATQAGITEAFSNWLQQKDLRPNDAVLVFFAGHGERGYLIPSDGVKARLGTTAVSMDWIKQQLSVSAIPCRHKLVILDSCYSGSLFQQQASVPGSHGTATKTLRAPPSTRTRGSGWQEDTLAGYVQGRAFLGISAGRDTVVVDEQGDGNNSLFTTMLLQVLEERGNSSRADHIFFGSRLATEIEERVANARGSKQRPKWGYLEPGDGDFVFRPTTRRSTPREISEDRRRKLKVRRYISSLRAAKSAIDRNDDASAAQLIGPALEDAELAARFECRFLNNLAMVGQEAAVTHRDGWASSMSASGTMLAYRRGPDLIIRDIVTGDVIRTWSSTTGDKQQEHGRLHPVSFNFADQYLIASDSTGSSYLLTLEDGDVVEQDIVKGRIRYAARSADGSLIAAITDNGVAIVESSGNPRLRHLVGEPEYYYSKTAVSPDGEHIAVVEGVPYDLNRPESGIKHRNILILQAGSGIVLGRINVEYGVSGLQFSPDGSQLAATYVGRRWPESPPLTPVESAEVRQVHLFDVGTHELHLVLDGFRSGNQALAFSPDGTTLAVASNPNMDKPGEQYESGSFTHASYVAFFDLWGGQEIYRMQIASNLGSAVSKMYYVSDNSGLLICETSGIYLLHADSSRHATDLADGESDGPDGKDEPPKIIQVDGKPFSIDNTGRFVEALKSVRSALKYTKLDVQSGEVIQSKSAVNTTLKFADQSNGLIPYIQVRNRLTRKDGIWIVHCRGQELGMTRLREFPFGSFELAWNDDRTHLASSGFPLNDNGEEGVSVWDIRTGRQKFHLGDCDPASSLIWLPGGSRFACVDLDGRTAIRDGESGEVLVDLGPLFPEHVAVSLDENQFACIEYSFISIYDLRTGRRKKQIDLTIREECSSIASNRDGTLIVTGHTDGSVFLWDVALGAAVEKFTGAHTSAVTCVAFTDNGSIVSASSDGRVEIRVVPPIERSRMVDDLSN